MAWSSNTEKGWMIINDGEEVMGPMESREMCIHAAEMYHALALTGWHQNLPEPLKEPETLVAEPETLVTVIKKKITTKKKVKKAKK